LHILIFLVAPGRIQQPKHVRSNQPHLTRVSDASILLSEMNHTNHADSTFKSELSKIATSATSPSNMESTSSESNSMIERISRSQSQICLHQRVHGWRQLNFWSVCWLTPSPRPPSKIPTRPANQYVRSLHSRMNPITFWFLSRSLLSTPPFCACGAAKDNITHKRHIHDRSHL